MPEDIDFERATEMISNWDGYYQDRFYEKFPETLQQEKRYDRLGLQQHEEEGFAVDLEGEDFDENMTAGTHESLRSQLATLSSTAGREATATQNITVYSDAMQLWEEAEDTPQLLEYLENYAEKRSKWNERDNLEFEDDIPLLPPRVQYGAEEDQEYVEEILTQLITETMHNV